MSSILSAQPRPKNFKLIKTNGIGYTNPNKRPGALPKYIYPFVILAFVVNSHSAKKTTRTQGNLTHKALRSHKLPGLNSRVALESKLLLDNTAGCLCQSSSNGKRESLLFIPVPVWAAPLHLAPK